MQKYRRPITNVRVSNIVSRRRPLIELPRDAVNANLEDSPTVASVQRIDQEVRTSRLILYERKVRQRAVALCIELCIHLRCASAQEADNRINRSFTQRHC